MHVFCKLTIVAAVPLALAACVSDPRAYETEPVKVQTSKGTVTCQLYTKDLVRWDRSISRPSNMSVDEADAICQAEGARQAGL